VLGRHRARHLLFDEQMRSLFVLLLAVLGSACDYEFYFHGQIAIAPAVAPAGSAPLRLLFNDDDRYPMEPQQGMWGSTLGGVYVIEPSASSDGTGELIATPPTTTYDYWHVESAGYDGNEFWLGAFVDLDGDNAPSPGEPYGIADGLPIARGGRHEQPSDALEIDIVIDQIVPTS